MKRRLSTRIATVLAVSAASMLAMVPAAMADDGPVAIGPCPAGSYGVQVIVQTPSGDKTVYACVQN